MESEERSDNAGDGQLPNDEGKSAEDANLLYSRGMAHYRRRQWREARDCFVRLKAIHWMSSTFSFNWKRFSPSVRNRQLAAQQGQ